jgi:hypothetical protein
LLTLRQTPEPYPYQKTTTDTDCQRIFKRFQKAWLRHYGPLPFLPELALINAKIIYILKPLNVAHWTQTAAFNYAASIVEHMACTKGLMT